MMSQRRVLHHQQFKRRTILLYPCMFIRSKNKNKEPIREVPLGPLLLTDVDIVA